MLTLGQQVVIESFAKELIKLIKNAIYNKPIKRISRRKVKGKYVDTAFSSPVNASGELAKTLRYELTDTYLKIYANDYIFELIYGKKPGGSVDVGKIKDWMSYKGIKVEGNIDTGTLASLIATKINRFGSSIYLANKGQNSGLLENIISQQIISDYNSKFTQQLSEDFKSAFING